MVTVWVMAEPRRGRPGVSVGCLALLPAAAAAAAVAPSVTAVHWGPDPEAAATEVGPLGAARLLSAGDPGAVLPGVPVASALAARIEAGDIPAAVVFAATRVQHEIAARLSARLDVPLLAGVVRVRPRPGVEGGLIVDMTSGGAAATVALSPPSPHLLVFAPAPLASRPATVAGAAPAEIELLDVAPDPDRIAAPVVERSLPADVAHPAAWAAIEYADVVVAGGRGLGDRETFALVGELARRLGGAPAASGGAVAAGWAPPAWTVGQSARRVRPRLYLSLGVSGASQHAAGMAGAAYVVAVDEDPAAPALATADVAIVGDARALLARLLSS